MAMDDLEVEWGRLKLTQEEEEVIEFEEVPKEKRKRSCLVFWLSFLSLLISMSGP